MRDLLRCLAVAAIAGVASSGSAVLAAPAGDCKPAAITKLRALSPDGYAVYRQIKDKNFFLNWITCDDVQLGLATAVHESVHAITSQTDAFPLVNGGEVKRPHEVSAFFAPTLIAKNFGRSDFVSMYLRPGSASSASDFLYLLDELNAYTHDLNAAIDLNSLRSADEEVAHRDGLASAMAFVARYVQRAEENEPATWSGLQTPAVAQTVSVLWGRAEGVMTASCAIPNFGVEDKTFLGQVCQPRTQSAMRKLLGRAPVCPTACLTQTSQRSD